MYSNYLCSLVLAVVSAAMVQAQASQKYVFAHFIVSPHPRFHPLAEPLLTDRQVGNAANMSPGDWQNDISLAKAAGIDGFALNIATQDSYTDTVLQTAYAAAESVGGFSLFLSFDYASGGPWQASDVVSKINSYSGQAAQFQYQGKTFVSTFEGTDNINDWSSIKSQTNCYLVPDWTSLGPAGFGTQASVADGAFSWDAWPEGASDMTDDEDQAWQSMLGSRPYMMGVSPWFYTNLAQWDKNWLWRGADLWHDRWQQVIELQPDLVEIITWNDYGESHYIGPVYAAGVPQGADYVTDVHTHEGWLALLPEYIAAYKSGNATTNGTAPATDTATVWYKINPGDAGNTGGTTGNNPGQGQPAMSPQPVSEDGVFFTVSVTAPSDVSVQIGSNQATSLRATVAGINHFSVPLNGATGAVTVNVSRNGQQVTSVTGPEITTDCADGNVNWNAVSVSSTMGGSSNTTSTR